MSVLLLMRHGQASLGTTNYDRLSDIGHRQAQLDLPARVLRVDAVSGRRERGTLPGLVESRMS